MLRQILPVLDDSLLERQQPLSHRLIRWRILPMNFRHLRSSPARKVVRVDLREVISEAYGLMRAEASDNATLNMELSKEPLPVRGDPSELLRTYINLIKNALEAVRDIDEGTITLTARQEEDQVITEVIDNGPGIPVEVQDRIYEPSFSTKTSGAGLGLAIARQAVELSGGSISFSTELGQGTTMRIDLPLDPGDE